MRMELQHARESPTPKEAELMHDNKKLVEQLVMRQLQIAEFMEDNAILQRNLRRITPEKLAMTQMVKHNSS